MTQEEKDGIKQGDILLCVKSDFLHFSQGSQYKVYDEDCVIWCDEGRAHFVSTLRLDMFELAKD